MDESTTSAPRTAAASVISVVAIQTILDSLLVAQPFQSGGSVADDLLLAYEAARQQLGDQRAHPDFTYNAISRRVDHPKRLKTKCDIISQNRYAH